MDGAFPSSLGEGEGERRRGFRGTQENAKTKLCLRCGPPYRQSGWVGMRCNFWGPPKGPMRPDEVVNIVLHSTLLTQ